MRIRELVRKEFIILFRDEKNRRVLIMAPIIQILIFGYVVNYDIKDIRMAVMDQARTSESRSLIKTLSGSKTFNITNYPEDSRGLEQLLLAGKVDIGIKIAPDMTSRIRKGQTADIPCQLVIIAVGTKPNPILLEATKGLGLNKRGYIDANPETGETSIHNVFAGGDIVTGAATVISAMGAGRKAAKEIAKRLLGLDA